MIIGIPLPCPSCGGRMYSASYDAPLPVLRRRVRHVCRECGFERDAEEFKRSVCCA